MDDLSDADSEDYGDNDDPEETEEDGPKSRKIKLSDRDTFDKFVEVLQTIQVQSSEVQRMVGEALNYELTSLNEASIIDFHQYSLILFFNSTPFCP